jgi:UDP-GlcNAc:undecaprenyl-phosphate GlcNAc-1-phosphate transferase
MEIAQIIYYSTNIFVFSLIFFIFKNLNFKLAKFLNIYDFPNKKKIHKKITPLVGGFTIFYVFLITHIIFFIKTQIEKDILLIVISSSIFFLIGLMDDKKNFGYLIKFFFFILVSFFTIYYSDYLVLNQLYFETFNKSLYLNGLSNYIITLLCILLLINATNLSDGINGLCIGIIIIWFSYTAIKFNTYLLSTPLITVMVLTLYYNFKGNFFLGNSGSHLLGCFIGLLIIYNYNLALIENTNSKISVEEIFILFMLPGFDMLRLFLFRIINKRNPFTSDLSHFHHYLLNYVNLSKSLIIYFLFMIIPIIIYNFYEIKAYIIICLSLITYMVLLKIISKKKS